MLSLQRKSRPIIFWMCQLLIHNFSGQTSVYQYFSQKITVEPNITNEITQEVCERGSTQKLWGKKSTFKSRTRKTPPSDGPLLASTKPAQLLKPCSHLLVLSRSPASKELRPWAWITAPLPQPVSLFAPSNFFTYFSQRGRFSYKLLLSCLLCTSCLLRELSHQSLPLSSEFSSILLAPSPQFLISFPSNSTFHNQIL